MLNSEEINVYSFELQLFEWSVSQSVSVMERYRLSNERDLFSNIISFLYYIINHYIIILYFESL